MKYSKISIYGSVFFLGLAGIARGNSASAGDLSIADSTSSESNRVLGGGGHHGGGGYGGGGGNHGGGGGHHGGGGYGGGGGNHGGGGGHHGGGGYGGGYYPPSGGYYPPSGGYYPPTGGYPVYTYPTGGSCEVLEQSGEATEACASNSGYPIQCYVDVSTALQSEKRIWGTACVSDLADCRWNGTNRVEACISAE